VSFAFANPVGERAEGVPRIDLPFEGEALPAHENGRTLIGALPAAVYTTDGDGLITYYNGATAELWGCRPELGKSEFCGSWKLYWPDGTPLPTTNAQWR
jgi:PAS domain-containing protein